MYWLCALPLLDSKDRTWNLLQQKTTYDADMSINYRFELPELRIGTLDSLMVLSDDLVKVNGLMEAVVNKIRRQLFEMQSLTASEDKDPQEVLVEGMPPDNYIEKFSWDEAKYPPRRPLQETVSTLTETVQKLEDDLKVRVSEYNQIKGQVNQQSRKQTGSLAVRDLSGVVSSKDIISTENLVTLFVVVSKHTKLEWQSSYEKFCEFVVPRSSKVVAEDTDNALFTVTLFRRVADTFKTAARTRGFQVREYEYDPDHQSESQAASQNLQSDAQSKRSQLEEWSATAYGEAFSAWIHTCAVRLFTESILRYGLPPQFLGVLMKPNAKAQNKLRKSLASVFGSTGSDKYFDDKEGGGPAGAEGEMYPYVSFSISIDS